MYATLMSLSEPKLGDVVKFEVMTHRGSIQESDLNLPELSRSSKELEKTSSGTVEGPVGSQKSHLSVPSDGTTADHHSVSNIEASTGVDVESISAASRRAAGMLNVLSSAQTSIFIGTELGQVILSDWLRNKDGTINQEPGQRGESRF